MHEFLMFSIFHFFPHVRKLGEVTINDFVDILREERVSNRQ